MESSCWLPKWGKVTVNNTGLKQGLENQQSLNPAVIYSLKYGKKLHLVMVLQKKKKSVPQFRRTNVCSALTWMPELRTQYCSNYYFCSREVGCRDEEEEGGAGMWKEGRYAHTMVRFCSHSQEMEP